MRAVIITSMKASTLALLLLFGVQSALAAGLPDLGDSSRAALSESQEDQIGHEIMRQVRGEADYLDDPILEDYLNTLGDKLAAASPESRRHFDYFPVRDPSINAFAMPGGFIGVNTGLISATRNESELAGVLGHETAHVTQHHIARMVGDQNFTGIATLAANAEGHNSVLHLAPGASRIGQYDKVRLMPFGEYGPAGFGWFSAALAIPLKDLRPGNSDQQAFRVGEQSIATLICHEDLIGEDARRWLPAATLFINPSNLAWFEGSAAIAQRLQVVRMRAMESGRPILRATNTGITAQIDQRGRVIRQLPEMQEGTLSGEVQAMQGLTPYACFGDWPVVFGSLMFVLFCLATKRMRGIP